jgi:NAD(P)-dependent dehydrogenase (short-subunit alcohol dehydrogenase family)
MDDEKIVGVALVTGAERGIGRGIALALSHAGYALGINYLDDADAANGVVAELHGDGLAVQGDVREASQVRAMVEAVVARFGRLDVLVNNAGIQAWSPLLELSESDWDAVIDTNLKGSFLCMQAAARQMRAQGSGVIINIGSGCNKVPFPELVSYTASKGGLEMLTKVAAVELGPLGIRVNCVAPGAIEVERTRRERPDYAATFGRITPLRRIGLPDDIGQAVVMLASPAAAFITGQTVAVDGGLFTQPPWP